MTISRIAVGAWVTVGLAGVLMLVVPKVSLPAVSLGLFRRFVTPEIGPDIRISQTFYMTGGGLRAIEFQPAGVGPASGTIRIELRDTTGHEDVLLRRRDVAAAEMITADTYRFEFTPVAASTNRFYRFDLTSPEESAAHGVAVWATKGERYEGGAMLVDGVERWADLAFRVDGPTPTTWQLLVKMPAWKRTTVIAGLAAIWLALGLVLRALVQLPVVAA